MSAQRLSPRKTRRLARITNLNVIRAWAHGGYTYSWVTDTHQHGWYDLKTGEWDFYTQDEAGLHYTSCRELFPGYSDDKGWHVFGDDTTPTSTGFIVSRPGLKSVLGKRK